jgi:hypothetical protein
LKTIYHTATSLDGFIATEDNSLDWLFSLGETNDNGSSNFIAQVGASDPRLHSGLPQHQGTERRLARYPHSLPYLTIAE